MQKKKSENTKLVFGKLIQEDAPAYKVIKKGPGALTNAEIFSNVLNIDLETSKEILNNGLFRSAFQTDDNEIINIKGIGKKKQAAFMSLRELIKRVNTEESIKSPIFTSSQNIGDYLGSKMMWLDHEVFGVLFLNQSNVLIKDCQISQGGITGTVADPRIILRQALYAKATSIVLYHNHPSGNLRPSQADKDITHKIKEAASYLDIRVLDHIIVTDEGYYSFADEGMI